MPNNKFILILDDEFEIVSLIKDALQRHGFDNPVFTFTEPSLALEHFKTNSQNCSLVISDIRMPGMTGVEFVKKVKDIKSDVKAFLMTAYDKEDVQLPSNMIIQGFLRKPFSLRELINLISSQLIDD